jgi:hypothetical protein
LIVNSSQGGGSKDTWILAADRGVSPHLDGQAEVSPPIPVDRTPPPLHSPAPTLGPLPEQDSQQQQQQQQPR